MLSTSMSTWCCANFDIDMKATPHIRYSTRGTPITTLPPGARFRTMCTSQSRARSPAACRGRYCRATWWVEGAAVAPPGGNQSRSHRPTADAELVRPSLQALSHQALSPPHNTLSVPPIHTTTVLPPTGTFGNSSWHKVPVCPPPVIVAAALLPSVCDRTS